MWSLWLDWPSVCGTGRIRAMGSLERDTGEMAIPAKPDEIEPAPETSGSTAADVLEAVVSPVATVITAWGKMPRVRTLLEYLARKILGWTAVCGGGLYVGGTIGTVAVAGSVAGLLIDTGVAAWNECRQAARARKE